MSQTKNKGPPAKSWLLPDGTRIVKSSKPILSKKPRKPRRGKPRARAVGAKTKDDVARKGIVDLVGGKGQDLTSTATTSPEGIVDSMRVAGTTTQLPVIATISTRAISDLAMGAVLTAIRNGWMPQIKAGENPYYAFKYLYEVLLTALDTTPPLNTGAPIWLWNILAALKPKQGNFKTGTVNYSWSIDSSSFPVEPVFTYCAVPNASVAWGTPVGSPTWNGFPQIIPADDTLYNPDNGAASFQSMCKSLPNTGPLNKIVTSTDVSMMEKDTSAFAVSYPEIGSSIDTSGGLAQTIYSERPIDSPILAKFGIYQPAGEFYRGWFRAGKSAGTPCYVVPRMSEFKQITEVRDKISPNFAFVNFDEFFYTLSTTLGMAIEKSVQQNQVAVVCPLSAQAVQFLLRQTIINFFGNHMAQDLFLNTAGTSLFTMVPFCVGPNGCGVTGSKMQLPLILAENIRCCMRKIKSLKSQAGFMNAFDLVTVLARPALGQLGNFTTTNPDVPFVYSGNIGTLEMPASLIDCSGTDNNTVVYFTPTGDIFEEQVKQWNNWITGLAGTLSPLVAVTAEPGVSALLTSVYTRSQVNNAAGLKVRTQEVLDYKDTEKIRKDTKGKPLPPKVLSREEKLILSYRRAATVAPEQPTYLDVNIEKSIISNMPPSSPVYKYISLFTVPVLYSEVEQDQASIQAWQTFQVQPYSIPADTVAGGDGGVAQNCFPTVASRLQKLAALDTKALNQQEPNDMVGEIIELGKQGRGGFFADVAGTLANAFIPGAGSVVSGFVKSFGG